MDRREQFGKNIEYIMDLRGYSKKMLADEVGCCPDTVSNWIRGKKDVKKKYVAKIGEVFGCDPLSLYTDFIVWKPVKKKNPVYVSEINKYRDINVNELISIIEGMDLSLYDIKYVSRVINNKRILLLEERRKRYAEED